jgi:dUTP pyrophosphatase
MIRFVKMGDFGVMPCFKTRESAGADFCLPNLEPVALPPGFGCKIGLQIGIEAPEGFRIHGFLPFLSMVPRSSLRKRGVSFLGEGIIDCDYRGEIQALLFNHSCDMIRLEAGEAIGQFILRLSPVDLLDCPRLDSVRGAGGFGSTGKGNQ